MYVRRPAWIEAGPRVRQPAPVVAPAVRVPAMALCRGSRRRGVGEYPGDACYDPSRPSWLPGWISDATEFACVMGKGGSNIASAATTEGANIYSAAEYGIFPAPVTVPPAAPASAYSSVPASWSPSQTTLQPGELGAANAAAANAAAASGAWNPAGNLPVSASGLSDFFSNYGGLLLAGVVGVGAAVLLVKGRR